MASTALMSNTKALVEAGYDHVAPAYLTFSIYHSATSARHTYLDKLLSHLSPSRANILELGCGAGVLCTQSLLERGHTVTGVDISSAQIALAKQHVPTATLIHADMMSLDFSPQSFDAVVGFYSLFHLPREEQDVMVGKIAGWLREGGWFLCNLHTTEGDLLMEDWMGAKMFSSGWGVDGNSAMIRRDGIGLRLVEDRVVVEKVGRMEEAFQWILAVKDMEREGGLDVGATTLM